MARNLSKSKIVAFRQCPKKLWLSLFKPELLETTAGDAQRFEVGYAIGDIAQSLYDTDGNGIVVDAQRDGFNTAMIQSQSLLNSVHPAPVFEAGLRADGLLAFVDVMLPNSDNGNLSWHMVEVKSATKVKDYYKEDAAIQAYIAKLAGVQLHRVSLAHVNNQWVYQGAQDYQGLLQEADLTDLCKALAPEVENWVKEAKAVTQLETEPDVKIGNHCSAPFACGFYSHCNQDYPVADKSVSWLPGRWKKALVKHVEEEGIIEMADVSDALLNKKQLRVKQVTLSGETYFNHKATKAALDQYPYPAYFLDFETASFAVPIWKGWRAYQQIPFQFSLHVLDKNLNLTHTDFLDLSGNDPTLAFAESMIHTCRKRGPIFVYNRAFESSRIKELATRYPQHETALLAINKRLVDLLPIAKEHYYGASQHGSWSIKKLLPAICPELNYGDLAGISNGGMAMEAYVEAIHHNTTTENKTRIQQELLIYCELDTYAMVKIWGVFTGIKVKEN